MPVWEYFKNRGLSPHHRATGPFCKILFTDKSLEEGSVKGGTCRPPLGDRGAVAPHQATGRCCLQPPACLGQWASRQIANCDSHDELTISIEFPCLSSPTSIEHASHRPPAHVAQGKQGNGHLVRL